MADNEKTRKIMTKPLPQILDEIEDSIRLADEATKIADKRIAEVERIARDARQLSELVRLALMDGLKAIEKRLSQRAPSVEDTSGK